MTNTTPTKTRCAGSGVFVPTNASRNRDVITDEPFARCPGCGAMVLVDDLQDGPRYHEHFRTIGPGL